MLFYAFVLLLLLLLSNGTYNKVKSFLTHLIIFIMIAFKGEVGCDFKGYLHRYLLFHEKISLLLSKGEYGWYLIEYVTYVNNWGYQMYTVFAAIISVGFFFFAQRKIRYIGLIAIIFQMIFVQLGLSGLRQFIAVGILSYAIAIYLFDHQKSFYKFLILILLAASFHISALALVFVLPFLFKFKKYQLFILGAFFLIGASSEIINSSIEKYDTRYIEGTSRSLGAWLRFGITAIILWLGLYKQNKNLYYLSLAILCFGLLMGFVNSIALHRFNYYLFPIACLILIKNYKIGLVNKRRMNITYSINILYFLFWFSTSRYADCFIPYNFFFL